MKALPPAVRRLWPVWLFLGAFALAAFVFADVLPAMQVLVSPDSGANFSMPKLFRRIADWGCGTMSVLNHDELLRILLPPLAFHEVSYMVSTALTALAMAAYLRAVGLAPLPCCAGGLALAFAGYNFTLFNAGHRGYFNMMPYAVLLFALVERAARRPRAVSFLLMGACAASGLAMQPDVMAFFLGLLIVYAVFRVVRLAAVEGAGPCLRTRWKGWSLGVLLALASFGVFGFGTLRHVFGDVVAGRKAQMEIADAEEKTHAESAESAEIDEAERHRRWIFSTNWSLPPEAAAEFVAPSFQGFDSGNPEAPYWGRIGRSDGWEETREGFANFRQHSLYVGAVSVGLALFALAAAGFAFVRVGGVRAPAAARDRAAVALFWGGVALVSLLLALGRFGFLYRFFYKLPMMDLVRGPLKFVHLVELAAAALAGFGVAAALDAAARPAPDRGAAPPASQPPEWRRARLAGKVSMFALLALALACLVAGLLFDPAAHADEWAAAGLPATAALRQALFDLYRGAMVRGAWLLALVAGFAGAATFLRGPRKTGFCTAAGWALAAVLAVDLALAAKPYVHAENAAPRFEQPPPAVDERSLRDPEGYGFSYLFLTGQRPVSPLQLPLLSAMDHAGLANRDPIAGDGPDSQRVKALIGFGGDFRRLWAFWGTAAVLAPADVARHFAQTGLAVPKRLYKVLPGAGLRFGRAATPAEGQVALLEPALLTPSLAVYHSWRGVGDGFDAALAAWKETDFDPAREIAVAGLETHRSDLAPEPANWNENGTPAFWDWLAAHVDADPKEPGLLLVRARRFGNRPLEAFVNGKPARVLSANGHAFAVEVPAGRVAVHLRVAFPWRALATGLAGVAVFVWLLVRWLRAAREEDAA